MAKRDSHGNPVNATNLLETYTESLRNRKMKSNLYCLKSELWDQRLAELMAKTEPWKVDDLDKVIKGLKKIRQETYMDSLIKFLSQEFLGKI